MRIFFDTEFTGLTDDAKLVSIGLINETGTKTFYAEAADTYGLWDLSEFCRRKVWPLLEHGDRRMKLEKLRETLFVWLSELGPDAVLVCDSPRDVLQLTQLFPTRLPANCSYQVLDYWGNLQRRVFNFGRRLHKKHGLRVHHALDDAKVNRLIFARK